MELNIDEALRYLGVGRQAPPELRQETEDTARRPTARLRPRYTYRVFSLKQKDGVLRLPEADLILPGKDAKKMLADCGWVVLLGCTLGAEFEGYSTARTTPSPPSTRGRSSPATWWSSATRAPRAARVCGRC